ncbi:sodium-dependent neutral amino acid transporter B(0)AT3-like isoform X2 [Corticium candelabrum]|nr:sodium-dependent neutral amino acid transporter B(0)AT3-like isoform X2 [Corticium candelabrum]
MWDNKMQYILSMVGFAVGVGNVWRFPYLCQKYGGGAFLIPYIIMLFIEGLPLFYLELSLGHRFHSGTVNTWRQVAPAFAGLGIAMGITSYITQLYYIIVMVWSLFYLFNSFHDPLPWMTCSDVHGTTEFNGTTVNVSEICNNGSTKFYWYNTAVQASSDIEHPGKMIWQLTLCLLLSWVVLFICLIKGIKSTGKAVYFTATFPYVVLLILFFRGVTLTGAGEGVAFLFTPDWSILYDPIVWLEAAAQILYSLGVGFGCLITYTSYSDPGKRPTPLKDTLLVAFINCGTSVFASIVIFAILGFKVHKHKHESIQDVASGPGLAFIAFSEALGQMPGGPFWSVLFFLMLVMLALDSMFGQIEVPLTDLLSELGHMWPFRTKWRILTILSVVGLLLGLVFVIQSGYYTFQLFNTYSVSLPLLGIALCECITVCWIYGVERFRNDMEVITGKLPHMIWVYVWKYVCPIVILCILVGSIIKQGIHPLTYHIYHNYIESADGKYPSWSLFCASFIILVAIGPVPIGVAWFYIRRWRTRSVYSLKKRYDLRTEKQTANSADMRSYSSVDEDRL